MKIWNCCLIILLFSLTGCTTKINALVKHESFNYPALMQEKIAIVGISSNVRPIKKKEQKAIPLLIYTCLLEKRHDLSLIQSEEVAEIIGTELRKQSLEEYRLTDNLSASVMDELKQKLQGVRYLLLARVDKDDISRDESISFRKKAGSTSSSSVEVRKRSTMRQGAVSLHIFDLKLGMPVWGGSVSKSVSRQNTFDVPPENPSLRLEDLAVDAFVGVARTVITGNPEESSKPGYDYPKVAQAAVLKKIFTGFAENLPDVKDLKENKTPDSSPPSEVNESHIQENNGDAE